MRRAILVFVKHPEPGRVKTRLAATVGAVAAAEIYRRLVDTVLARLPGDAAVVVCFDPPERRAEVELWLAGKAQLFLPQAAGDLGTRLTGAFAEVFALGFAQVAVIGTDCVEIDPGFFSEAWTALETCDAVLGPSADGGYYLLALRVADARLFQNIDWSTPRVLAQTLQQAAEAGLRVHLLPTRHDVDTEEDWRRAERKLAS